MDLTATQKAELKANVINGGAFLDNKYPTWRDDVRQTIDQDSPLQMDDHERDLLGRLLEVKYKIALTIVFPSSDWRQRRLQAVQYGFTLPDEYNQNPLIRFVAWRYLEECWLAKL